MGSACTRPILFENTDVVSRYLTNPEMVDFPRAATAFEKIGSHEYAVLCWLAAGKPDVAERVYNTSGITVVDNRYGDTPIWRMIIFTRIGDYESIKKCKEQYLSVRQAPWISHIVAAI